MLGLRDSLVATQTLRSCFLAVNNVGVMYDYPQYFLDVPEDVSSELRSVRYSSQTQLQQQPTNITL